MRALFAAALAIALGTPALAQTPPPETVTFENVGTPMPYAIGASVPDSARVKSVTLAGGGLVRFRTRGGANYAALVTHFGTTAVVGVGNKGKIQPFRDLEIRIRKSPGARLDSFVAIQAGERIDDNGTTDDKTDDETFYDNPGAGQFLLYDADNTLYPASGARLAVLRAGGDPLNLVKDPYNLTTTSLDFTRILCFGDVVYDDLVVSYGH